MRLWILAIAITLAAAAYQRMSGPTYPFKDKVVIGGQTIHYKLARSHGGPGDQQIEVPAPDPIVTGELSWRRYPTADAFATVPMRRDGENLVAAIPHQPASGKIEYKVRLDDSGREIHLPPRGTVITRFKGAVPAWILGPHILAMFLGMLYANRAGLEALRKKRRLVGYTRTTLLLIGIGGMILGPIVQKYAFGAFWTGVPFGWDLTDNKTLIAFIAWLIAMLFVSRMRGSRGVVIAAALITLIVFAIPHSLFGSQLKY
jgi:hypothetical protein